MEKKPFLFAISGVKNSGKTTLITKLIPILTEKGLKVATIKHDGHDFEPDVPGTDTHEYLLAGACGTAIFSDTKFMIVKQESGVTERQLIEQFPEADIILLEGFKYSDYPKMEIVRKGNSTESVCPSENLVAVLSDFTPESEKNIPVLDLNDTKKIAEMILAYWYARTNVSMVVLAGGLSSRMGTDKSDLCWNGKTFLETQIEKGRKLGITDIIVSGYQGQRCEVPVIFDRYEKKGPLGGMEACLRRAENGKCLVLSVDVPLISIEDLRGLLLTAMESDSKAVLLQHGEKQEPLAGVYDVSLADAMEREILEEKGSVFAFLKKAGYDVYMSHESEECFLNVNDEESYRHLEEL